MIFDAEDLTILNRTMMRKSSELAMTTFDHDLGEAERLLRVGCMVTQLNRLRIMAAIGVNDVAELGGLLDEFGRRTPVPSDMMESYLAKLKEQDTQDEAAVLWMEQEIDSQMPLLREAVRIADECGSDCSIKESDVVVIRGVRDFMKDVAERCDGQDPEVLGDAAEYIEGMSALCTVLLRISSMSPVSSLEISVSLIVLGKVGEEDFDRLFGDLEDEKVR